MLADELAGQSYVKSDRNSTLQSIIGRNRGSIERKHMNISAVMARLGLPRIRGYAPNANFQAGLIDAVERYLNKQGLPNYPELPKSFYEVSEQRGLWIGPPPVPLSELVKSTPELDRLVGKFDPAERDERNRPLGKEGERLVLEHEIRRLNANNRSDLATKVEWTSEERGDGAGFDIASFEADGKPRLIEVKTTNGSAVTPFYLSENERSFSEERPSAYTLLRLYNFSSEPKAFELRPPLSAALCLAPISYRASLS